jgi:hypothetical protein
VGKDTRVLNPSRFFGARASVLTGSGLVRVVMIFLQEVDSSTRDLGRRC